MLGSPSTKGLLLAASISGFLSPIAHAQNNSTNTTSPQCPDRIDWLNSGNSTINATGQAKFTWTNSSIASQLTPDPWYVNLLVNDSLRESLDQAVLGGIDLFGFVSVPNKVKNVSLCTYQFAGINGTLDSGHSDGHDTCGGLVSDECMEYIRGVMLSTSGTVGEECPNYMMDGKGSGAASGEFQSKCPNLRDAFHDVVPREVSNRTCAFTDLPGIDVPDDYHHLGTGGSTAPFKEYTYVGNFTQSWDLVSRQTVPYIVYGEFVDPESNQMQKMAQFVCVQPNMWESGTRIPSETPWGEENDVSDEGAGVRIGAGRMMALVAAVVGVMLVL